MPKKKRCENKAKQKGKKEKEKQFVSLGKRKVISEVNNNITVP